jgi:hypothetical protein
VGKQHADHLTQAIEEHYAYSQDWAGKLYCGIIITWNYAKCTTDLSIPGYIAAALHKFQHKPPAQPQHAPHKWNQPTYGAKQQFATLPDKTPPLGPDTSKSCITDYWLTAQST